MRRKVDMEAIAKVAGVSKTTVHHVMHQTGRIGDDTRKRVLDAIAELGYRPNLVARSLRAQRTCTVGVIVGEIAGSNLVHIVEGIDSVAEPQEYSILLATSQRDPVREQRMADLLLARGADGLLVMPAHPTANSTYFDDLISGGARIVFMDRELLGCSADIVSTDNIWGGYLAARHLMTSGRSRLGFVTTISSERRSTSVQARLVGCNRALDEAGLPAASELGLDTEDVLPLERFAYNAVKARLSEGDLKLDALFAAHDGIAYGAIEALLDCGLRVPEDVAVVGFDDLDTSAFVHPPLSTVRQPSRDIGAEAMRLLLRRLEEETAPGLSQRITLEPSLVIRKSCGAAEECAAPLPAEGVRV